jgi:flagellar basal-body rod modification protein FlgD
MAVEGTSGTSSGTNTTTSSASSNRTGLGQDAFLKLLVTQLQNQDPMSPTDNTQFIAQLATFSSLEQLTTISSGIKSLSSEVASINTLLTSGSTTGTQDTGGNQ